MANNDDGMISFLPEAMLRDLKAVNAEVVTMMTNIPKLNKFLENTKTPAQADGSFKALTTNIEAATKKQTDSYEKLRLAENYEDLNNFLMK